MPHVIQGKFVFRGYLAEDEIIQSFHTVENRWVKFRSVEEDEIENDESSSSMNIYRSTTIEGIDEDGEECDEMVRNVTACVVISI